MARQRTVLAKLADPTVKVEEGVVLMLLASPTPENNTTSLTTCRPSSLAKCMKRAGWILTTATSIIAMISLSSTSVASAFVRGIVEKSSLIHCHGRHLTRCTNRRPQLFGTRPGFRSSQQQRHLQQPQQQQLSSTSTTLLRMKSSSSTASSSPSPVVPLVPSSMAPSSTKEISSKGSDPGKLASDDSISNSNSLVHASDDVQGVAHDDNVEDIEALTRNWRDLAVCNPAVTFKSWLVATSGKSIQTILNSTLTQPYLAHRLSDPLDHLHVRFKLVHDNVNDSDSGQQPNRKLVLLHPDTPSMADLPEAVRTLLLDQCQVTDGPDVAIQFYHHQLTASYLLERLLPRHAHPVPTAFETVGHVAHLNLRPPHVPYQYLIGQVLLATLPSIETVICKVGDVSGPYRTYDMHVLAGRPDTKVQLVESGVTLQFDLALVYWCSRLSEERQRLLRDEIFARAKSNNKKSESIETNTDTTTDTNGQKTIVIADVFCGVGALCLRAVAMSTAMNKATPAIELWVNDWNPHAVAALQENAVRNGVSDYFTRVSCGDTYDFLMDLGIAKAPSLEPQQEHDPVTTDSSAHSPQSNGGRIQRDSDAKQRRSKTKAKYPSRTKQADAVVRLPDHVVMNFPLEAPQFLGALRWWPSDSGIEPRVHVYTFARAMEEAKDRVDGTDTNTGLEMVSAEDVAVDLVANNLIPQSVVTMRRRTEINEEYDCNVKVHAVRDVAPGKSVFCVSFTATSKLLRHMRGDFS